MIDNLIKNIAGDKKMLSLSPEQEEAINTRGKNIIVSAQAGAGKTFSLVKRIISLVLEGNDIDRFLIVTFTNKAAFEMKDRIKKALGDLIDSGLDDQKLKFIQRQYVNINNAQISTMHSFCINNLRAYFNKIGLEANFKLLSEEKAKVLKWEIIDSLFMSYYQANDLEKLNLISDYSKNFTDENAKDMILDIYNFMQSQKNPFEWFDRKKDLLYKPDQSYEEFIGFLEGEVRLELKDFLKVISRDMDDLRASIAEGGLVYEKITSYEKVLESDKKIFDRLEKMLPAKLEELVKAIKELKFSRMPSIATSKLDEEKKSIVENLKDSISTGIKNYREAFLNLVGDYINFGRESYEAGLLVGEKTRIIGDILRDFDKEFKLEKRKRNCLDFSDLEHLMIDLLDFEDVQKELRERFKYIFFDEYQDANRIQNYIVEKIARGDNLFFVGDIKQSIYKFRLAEPRLFKERYDEYSKENTGNLAVDFKKNYRTRPEISKFNNFIFESLMTEDLAGIDYKSGGHELVAGKDFDKLENKYPVEIIYLLKDLSTDGTYKGGDEGFDIDIRDKSILYDEAQAYLVAKKIREMIDGGSRPGDFAILLRNSTIIQEVCDNLKEFGIDFFSDSYNFKFSNLEVRSFVDILRNIDNDLDDMNLIACLKGPIGNFTDEEIALIRGENRKDSFSYIFHKYIEGDKPGHELEISDGLMEKIRFYSRKIIEYRNLERIMSLANFVYFVFVDSGYKAYILSQEDGKKKLDNILAFIEEVASFEEDFEPGLYKLLTYIDKLEKLDSPFTPGADLSEEDDVVRVMTMHKSKGLEFKNVFLINTSNKFNKTDINKNYIANNEMGLVLKEYDQKRKIFKDNYFFNRAKKQALKDILAEETRILYVAMTRAIDRLFIMGTYSLSKKSGLNNIFKMGNFSSCNSHFDWINKIVLADWQAESFKKEMALSIPSKTDYFEEEVFKIRSYYLSDIISERQKNKESKGKYKFEKAPGLAKKIEDFLAYKYPFPRELNLAYKKTVSDLAAKNNNKYHIYKDYEKLYEKSKLLDFDRPAFIQEDRGLEAREIGSLNHYLLQVLPFRNYSEKELEKEIASLVERNFLSENELSYIDLENILNFFNSALAERIMRTNNYFREESFTMVYKEEGIGYLLDGQVDLFFIEDGRVNIVDFKTDRTLIPDRYKRQLELYGEGVSKALGLELGDKIIYWVNFNQETYL